MRFIILSCLAATAALAGPSPHEWARNNKGVAESLDGVTWAPLAWDAQAFPGGPKLTLRGTVQEVHDQLLAANPEWETDFARNTTSESPTHDERSANFMGAKVECKEWKYGQPKHAALLQALNHWNNVAGPGPVLAPGPRVCSVVYYDSDTTIVLCNADSVEKRLDSYSNVSAGLQAIRATCLRLVMMQKYLLGGEAFNPDKWSIIVKKTGMVGGLCEVLPRYKQRNKKPSEYWPPILSQEANPSFLHEFKAQTIQGNQPRNRRLAKGETASKRRQLGGNGAWRRGIDALHAHILPHLSSSDLAMTVGVRRRPGGLLEYASDPDASVGLPDVKVSGAASQGMGGPAESPVVRPYAHPNPTLGRRLSWRAARLAPPNIAPCYFVHIVESLT
ncbi:hypothetical protein PCL_04664 [Purpureocillium lilacinum]|uniref:Uncharacterized protein n=1 Tax=Purpureocillium lilacinum TaxID=33203 RepID=A0A2U3DX29_PURLI|nr:hypothetical protein Purlil1_4483 [Purpureocillium lilacinum]PWI66820.1 hypothetical protein PCL_04664 [Purpureocillium lilacinum]